MFKNGKPTTLYKKSYIMDDGDFPKMDGGEFQGAVIFVIIIVGIIYYLL